MAGIDEIAAGRSSSRTAAFFATSALLRRAARDGGQRRGKSLAGWVAGAAFLGDSIAIYAGLVGAFLLRFHTPMRKLGHTASTMPFEAYRGHFIFLCITLLLVFIYAGLYGSGRPLRLRRVYAATVTSVLGWFLANLALSFELNTQPIVSRIFLFDAAICVAGAVMLWRLAFDRLLSWTPICEALQRRIVFVGWSEQTAQLAQHIADDRKHPYKIVGCVPSMDAEYSVEPPAYVEKLGAYPELADLLSRHAVDIMIVGDANPSKGDLLDLVTLCEKEMVHLQVIPTCFQVLLSGLHLETTSGVPVLGISRLPLDHPFNQMLKRLLDIVGSVIGLILSAPLVAVCGALVYLESPGPIFYHQRRLGINGKLFQIVKIRSMRLDAEGDGQVGWSRRTDDRRLKIGSWMRRLNLDEVPQFWNVLIGDMSLVGPRPERPELIVNFKEIIPHYNARHGIKPGITGWAQVNGFRGDTDLTERIKCDLYYMENWNLLMEFQILLMTFFKRTNAA